MESIQEIEIDLPIFLDSFRKSNLASQTVQKIFMVTSTNSFHHMVSKVSISYKGITESRSSLPQHSFRSSNLPSHKHQLQIWFHSMYNCFVQSVIEKVNYIHNTFDLHKHHALYSQCIIISSHMFVIHSNISI